jgi:hypothetical protein
MKKKSLFFGLLIVVLSMLALVACPPPHPPAQQTVVAPPVVPKTGLVLDGAYNYTVVKGDTLSDIAAKSYGGSNMYFFALISLANPELIGHPDLIEPGMDLIVPQLEPNIDSDSASAMVRDEMHKHADLYERELKPNAATKLRQEATKISK